MKNKFLNKNFGWMIFLFLIILILILGIIFWSKIALFLAVLVPQNIGNSNDNSETTSCTDSDEGLSYYMAGYVTDQDGIKYYDNCEGNLLTEYYCLNDKVATREVACPLDYECYETRSGDFCEPLFVNSEVGDNVGEGTEGFGAGSSGDYMINPINLIDWTTGGDYVLGAKITRTWNYVGDDCYGPEQFPMEWTLYDSNGMAWQIYDYFPVDNAVDYVCPVTYHEDAPWKFVVSVGIQACPVEYGWNVQPYICEVLD